MIIYGLKVLRDCEVFGKQQKEGDIIDVDMDESVLKPLVPEMRAGHKPTLKVVKLKAEEVTS